MTEPLTAAWLLLIHQVPPKPHYLRVKIGRRLGQVGAVAVKSTVYALPNRPSCRENFEWIVREIMDEGGEALLCETTLVEGLDDAAMRDLFQSARNADFEAVAAEAEDAVVEAEADKGRAAAALGRLERKLAGIRRLDFFDAPSRATAEEALGRLKSRLRKKGDRRRQEAEKAGFRGRIWVTRRDVEEDRIASAWLIRRFVDPAARFEFVSEGEGHTEGELSFDMFGGEFTHQGDRCTFEVLAERFAPEDDALSALAEIVHEIDIGDEKFSRPETPGVERIIRGLVEIATDDADRLSRGGSLFDALYRAFAGTGGATDAG
ncbi:MAG TPA: chromate resistance protein ChrB domain-containing protein [Thermoanaerobaculia bacterium]|nr:chromate resistance protein ChrB domain-containing protein [Thermoanaerobaculia bacterium]